MSKRFKSLLLSIAAVLATCFALQSAASSPGADADAWALEIVHKEIDTENQELHVVVRNSSDDEPITAFGVEMVYADAAGRGGAKSKAEDRLLGEPLRPGESTELKFSLAGGPYDALTVYRKFEILSDNSSRGDQERIETFFLERAHYAFEVQRVLAELRSARWNKAGVGQFFARNAERATEARAQLAKSMQPRTKTQQARWSASKSVAGMVDQIEQKIRNGEPEDEALDFLEWILEETVLDKIIRGVRPSDLNRPKSQQEDA